MQTSPLSRKLSWSTALFTACAVLIATPGLVSSAAVASSSDVTELTLESFSSLVANTSNAIVLKLCTHWTDDDLRDEAASINTQSGKLNLALEKLSEKKKELDAQVDATALPSVDDRFALQEEYGEVQKEMRALSERRAELVALRVAYDLCGEATVAWNELARDFSGDSSTVIRAADPNAIGRLSAKQKVVSETRQSLKAAAPIIVASSSDEDLMDELGIHTVPGLFLFPAGRPQVERLADVMKVAVPLPHRDWKLAVEAVQAKAVGAPPFASAKDIEPLILQQCLMRSGSNSGRVDEL